MLLFDPHPTSPLPSRSRAAESFATGWTEERVALLKALWLDGLSAATVARRLGGVTRNAVIGKVHRLGLSGRAQPATPGRSAVIAAKPGLHRAATRKPRAAGPADLPRPFLVETVTRASTPSSQMRAGLCSWPIGDPKQPGFGFCGAAIERGPYCKACARLAYQPRSGRLRESGRRAAG